MHDKILEIQTGYTKEDLESGKAFVKAIIGILTTDKIGKYNNISIKTCNDIIQINDNYYNLDLKLYTDTTNFDKLIFNDIDINLSQKSTHTNFNSNIIYNRESTGGGYGHGGSSITITVEHPKFGILKSYGWLNNGTETDYAPVGCFNYNGYGYILLQYAYGKGGEHFYELQKLTVEFEVVEE